MVPLLALAWISLSPQQSWVGPPPLARSPLRHSDAWGTATVRIIAPAQVGADLGPPRPGMTPRIASLTVPGAPDRLLLIYDFE